MAFLTAILDSPFERWQDPGVRMTRTPYPRVLSFAAAAWIAAVPGSVFAAAPRVFSLDQCADQYVLALSPSAAIVGLSPRAKAPDSALRSLVGRAPIRRASTEAVMAAAPQVVVRSWGSSAGLDRALAARHIAVAKIEDAQDFNGVRANIRRVAQALDADQRGEALVARMDRTLAEARGAWGGRRALYLTVSAYTAGPGTMVDAMLRAAGLTNAVSAPGFGPAPLEQLILNPPGAVVEGFFETAPVFRWAPGRNPILRTLIGGRVIASLPGEVLACSSLAAADGALRLAQAARAGAASRWAA